MSTTYLDSVLRARGLLAIEVAEELGIGRNTVCRARRGTRVSARTWGLLAAYLNEPAELLKMSAETVERVRARRAS